MEPNNGIKTWQWVVTVIVIIILIVIGVMVANNKGDETNTNTPEETPVVTEETGSGYRLVVTDQNPGNVVYLSSVEVATTSWVAIQADNAGLPGKVLGSAKFNTGINPGKITLSSSMVNGGTYYAVVYPYNGEKTLDASKTSPLKDSKGNVIMKVFKASSTAGVDFKG
jgi:hypothetical protein